MNESAAQVHEAEAALEGERKIRILFERAAKDALPFLVYVLYLAVEGLVALNQVLAQEGAKLYVGAILVLVISGFPLLLLPRRYMWWLRQAPSTGEPESE